MDQKYSQMSIQELKAEIADLKVKAQKAEQMGMINEFAVYERKMLMAEAYLLNPLEFKPGEVFEIKENPNEWFEIDYMNGVFAWGYRNNQTELEAIPISVFGKRK